MADRALAFECGPDILDHLENPVYVQDRIEYVPVLHVAVCHTGHDHVAQRLRDNVQVIQR